MTDDERKRHFLWWIGPDNTVSGDIRLPAHLCEPEMTKDLENKLIPLIEEWKNKCENKSE